MQRIHHPSCNSSFVDDGNCLDIEELSEEDEEKDDVGSQVTLSTMETYESINFTMPCGLNSFTVVLPAKPDN